MKNLSYLNQIIILAIWVIVVGALFSLIQEKQVAGIIAGIGFIFIPVVFLFSEMRQAKKNIIHLSTLGLFLIASALPIFFLRVLNWGVEFKDLSLLGISAEQLHRSSNILYSFMFLSAIYCYVQSRRNK